MKCWLCLRRYESVEHMNTHVTLDHPTHLNEEQTYAKVRRRVPMLFEQIVVTV